LPFVPDFLFCPFPRRSPGSPDSSDFFFPFPWSGLPALLGFSIRAIRDPFFGWHFPLRTLLVTPPLAFFSLLFFASFASLLELSVGFFFGPFFSDFLGSSGSVFLFRDRRFPHAFPFNLFFSFFPFLFYNVSRLICFPRRVPVFFPPFFFRTPSPLLSLILTSNPLRPTLYVRLPPPWKSPPPLPYLPSSRPLLPPSTSPYHGLSWSSGQFPPPSIRASPLAFLLSSYFCRALPGNPTS